MAESKKIKKGLGHCGVPQCNSYKSPSISLHRIPKRILELPLERSKWKIALKMEKEFPKKFLICSRHFQAKYLLIPIHKAKLKVYLAKSAFPTENLPKSPVQPEWIQNSERDRLMMKSAPILKASRNVSNRKVLLQEPTKLATHHQPTLHDQPEIAFEYVEIKQEPISFMTDDQQPPLDPSTPISVEIKPEPEDDSPLPSPITLYSPTRGFKRILLENTEIIKPAESYITQKNKPVMIDQACQTEQIYIQDATKDDKDKLIAILKRQNKQLKERVAGKETRNQFGKIPIESLKGNNKKICHLTGFPNFVTLEIIYKDVEKYLPAGKISKFDTFFITWMKLRLNLSLSYLSILMDISIPTTARLFYESFVILYGRLSEYIVWPDVSVNRENTTIRYKQIFGNRRCTIIDCFELFSEQMDNITNLNSLSRPVKYLMCFSVAGKIIYLSKSFDTGLTKTYIAQRSGFLGMIGTDDIILANCEFATKLVDKLKSTGIIPMVKNVEGELVEMTFEITDEFNKIRRDILKTIRFVKKQIMLLANRPPVLAVTKKYGEEMYLDFVIKMACAIVNLTPPQAEIVQPEKTNESCSD